MSEILNIEYHIKPTILKAMNRYGFGYMKAAARDLGISERSLYRYKHDYDIEWDEKKQQYYSKRQEAVLINQS